MQKSRIDNDELFRLVKQRKTVSEIAAFFGVQPPAVCKRLKKLNIAIARDIALRSAPEIVNRVLLEEEGLSRIHDLVLRKLDDLEQSINGANKTEKQALQEQQLKYISEARKQLSLSRDFKISDAQLFMVARIQEELLAMLDEMEPGLRQRFMNRLAQRNQIHSALSLPGGISRMKECDVE